MLVAAAATAGAAARRPDQSRLEAVRAARVSLEPFLSLVAQYREGGRPEAAALLYDATADTRHIERIHGALNTLLPQVASPAVGADQIDLTDLESLEATQALLTEKGLLS